MEKSETLPRNNVIIGGIAAACLLLLAQGCCSIKHLDREDFLKASRGIGSIGSTLHDTEYIGATRERVYIQRWEALSFFRPETMVYWTERHGLPAEVIKAMENGQPPWTIEKSLIDRKQR
jgi:hypothetical protein